MAGHNGWNTRAHVEEKMIVNLLIGQAALPWLSLRRLRPCSFDHRTLVGTDVRAFFDRYRYSILHKYVTAKSQRVIIYDSREKVLLTAAVKHNRRSQHAG